MSEFGDKSAATVKESAGRSALEASTKLSELFMEVATNKGDEQSFRAEMDEKLKDVLPSLSIVAFQKDGLIKYDTDGDGAVSDKEMESAIKSDTTSQKDKLMLTHLAKQYEALKDQNKSDSKDGTTNANGITNKDVETYLKNNPGDKPLLASDGSTSRDFGTWQEKTLSDGTIVKTSDGKVFQYVPQGDYSKFSNIETQANGKVTINGKEVELAKGDSATMDEKGAVTITHADKTSEVHHADGTVEKRNDKGEPIEITGCGIHAVRDKEGKWYVPGNSNANPATQDTYLKDGTKPERGEDGSIVLDFGTWQQKNLPDGTIVKTSDGTIFQYVPQGDWSKCSSIEGAASGKITVNGKEVKVAPDDKVSMDANGDVTIKHADNTSEVHHANGIVEKKDDKGETVEIQGNGVHAVRDGNGKWYVPGDPNANPRTENMYLADGKKPEIGKDGSIFLDFGTWQQRSFSDGTIVKTADGKVYEFVPQGDWNRVCHWNGTEWVDKDGKPTNVKHVEIDAQNNVKVVHKDDSYDIYHPDGSYEIYDEKGNKKCDVDAETAKSTEEKKDELKELSKIESGKGPYDAAKKMLEAAGVSPLTHKMILQFARWLRDEVAQKKSFKTGDQLVDDNNWQRVADKINEMKASQKK